MESDTPDHQSNPNPYDEVLIVRGLLAMKRPAEVQLSREEGEALRQRLEGDALTADDRRVLGQILQWYFGLVFTLQEAKFSLKRLRAMLFGDKPKKRQGGSPDWSSAAGGSDGGNAPKAEADGYQPSTGGHHPGHGRQGAEAYVGAERMECRHEELAVGERCPVCGQGRLYRLPPGVAIRIDGNALLKAVRDELEKLRCSPCGQVFTAALPDEVGRER